MESSYSDTQRTSSSPEERLMKTNMIEALNLMPYSIKSKIFRDAIVGESIVDEVIQYISTVNSDMVGILNPCASLLGYLLRLDRDMDTLNKIVKIINESKDSGDDISEYIYTFMMKQILLKIFVKI